MTARRKRHTITPMTYRMPPDIQKRIDDLVESGEYVNRAEATTALLRFALDHRNFDLPTALKEYLETEEGITMIKVAAGRRIKKKR